ncbi:MAG: TIGR02757 family protein [Cyclobacteriaceae bacterium]|nr:TIGR02757 family protein [Cyclobacteriaceae bacterium]UYN85908.1 MAG: TIGR02757 family protein [Cyclobacteriaceae bacterium]
MQRAKVKKQPLTGSELKSFLDQKVLEYNQPGFIGHDPVSIPHLFSKKQDIEIAGFFAATLAWGQRITIINNCRKLLAWMDNDPHQFILHHSDKDLKPFTAFRHRTFNPTDALYFIEFLTWFYSRHTTLEDAFQVEPTEASVEKGLVNFHNLFFSLPEFPPRTKKHVATPERKSACKRLTMYLRWMVREDNNGVDFGLWKRIKPSQLVCPLDVHVERVARKLKLIKRKQTNWLTALELTENLRKLDADDPVKYDFALFGLGLEKF